MKLSVFASGSTGNCLLLSDLNTDIFIDAGISMRRMQDFLFRTGRSWRDIGGVLITHEHSDHICALEALLRRTALPVYAPPVVAAHLSRLTAWPEGRLRVVEPGEAFEIGALSILPFRTPHDTEESVGYRVTGSGVFALATDMGCVTEEVLAGLLGADAVLIEANHDLAMLVNGPYPYPLKRRILSEHGHLSNLDCARLARQLALSGTRQIVLGHLSRENNRPELALQTVSAALEGLDTELCCAPVLGPLELTVRGGSACCTSN